MDADEDFFDKFKDESYDDFFTREQPSQPAKPSPQARVECLAWKNIVAPKRRMFDRL